MRIASFEVMKNKAIVMYSKFLVFAFLFISLGATAQSDMDQVRATLLDYIEGTASGDVDRIRRAFASEAALWTVGKEGGIRKIPIEQYIGYFKPGKATGRKGHITAVNLVNNAATAVVEVDMSSRRYTDYILLLKVNESWKIIQKSYTYEPFQRKGRLLFVVSSQSTYGEGDARTGAHFGEIVVPYHYLSQAGYEIDIVSPAGGAVPVSYVNLQDSLQRHYFYDLKFNEKLGGSMLPNDVHPARYDGIYFAGGGAAMFDLPKHTPILEITRQIYEDQNGVLGAVCHGPAGFVNVKLSDGSYLVDGKRVTSFTNEEEAHNSKKELLPFLLQSELEAHGANFIHAKEWASHVEIDGRLVTGQNPASCKAFAEAMIELLDASSR